MVDLNGLVLFAKVVEAKSFSEAARRLKVPLATVSRRIADLEAQLGVRLLERSTRHLRLTSAGTKLLEHAERSVELNDAVASTVSYQTSTVAGTLRISAMPSVSDSLIVPVVDGFQARFPQVRVQILVTERNVDLVAEGIDLAFRFGPNKDSSLVAHKLLTYRHRLVASPAYLARVDAPASPPDLLQHRLVAFSHLKPERTWNLVRADGTEKVAFQYQPHLSMNDYTGIASALLASAGIGDLPPIVQPELVRDGRLVEVMPKWKFRTFDLTLVHLGNRHVSRPVQLFKEFAVETVPQMFPDLPK